MSGSITSSVCALCRRPLPPDDTAGSATRLCDNCRKMVDNIRPAATRPVASGAVNTPAQEAEHVSEAHTSPQTSNSGFDNAQPGPQPAATFAIPASPANPEPASPAWADTPTQDSSAPPVCAGAPRQASPAKPTRPELGRTEPGRPDTPQQQPTINNGRGYSPRREPPANTAWSDVVMVPSGADSREAPFQSSAEESAYHQNWPIMVEESPAKKRGKGIFILVLLAVAGLSAVVGFVVFKDRFFGPRAGTGAGPAAGSPNRPAIAQDPKPTDPRSAQATASPASAQSPDSAKPPGGPGAAPVEVAKPQPSPLASQPQQTSSPVTASTQPASGGAGQSSGAKMTLQAASFPSENSARQFQDKLVKAGLPAYVVAADIPHRGRWYRVRAGKFASQEEAHQAAESFRKQAAAAGITLQLVPCDYQ